MEPEEEERKGDEDGTNQLLNSNSIRSIPPLQVPSHHEKEEQQQENFASSTISTTSSSSILPTSTQPFLLIESPEPIQEPSQEQQQQEEEQEPQSKTITPETRKKLNRKDYIVLAAAFIGWACDSFDNILFTYVAPFCVPYLLGNDGNSESAKKQIVIYTAILNSLLLFGWGVGGVVFGFLTDRLGRSRTMMITVLLCLFQFLFLFSQISISINPS